MDPVCAADGEAALSESRSRLRAIAFDLDGTLVDSAPDIGYALNVALAGSAFAGFDIDRVRQWIGDGPDVLILRALAALGVGGADVSLRARLRAAFDDATLEQPLARGHVYAGMSALLQRLQPDWPLVVVTNKPTALARAVLDAAALLPHFTGVYGADRTELRKPAPALLRQAARDLGLAAPQQLLMVGDSAADLGAALAAGCPAAWAEWGYGGDKALPHQPQWRLARPGDLWPLLRPGS